MSSPHLAVLTPTSIVSVQTYTVTLHPQYRATNKEQAAMIPPGQESNVSAGGRSPQSASSSGGVVSWFLFLLKMIGILAFVAFAVAAYVSLDLSGRSTI